MNKITAPELSTPLFKKNLKTALEHYAMQRMQKRIRFYKLTAIAAMLLFCISTLLLVSGKKPFDKDRAYRLISESMEASNTIDTAELDKTLLQESMKSGKQVYPTEIKSIMVKKIRLSNGKEVIIQSELDNGSYAIAY